MIPNELIRFKELGKPITVLTAWDSISSSMVEEAGADVVLVGDSLAMVALGHQTTLPVTIEQMLHHAQAVCRGFSKSIEKQPLVICDLPFLSYQIGINEATEAAGTLIKNSRTAGVKLEGAEPETLLVIERLIRVGIPVMGHLGLTPQSVNQMGYKIQASDEKGKNKIFDSAKKLESAGCFAVVLEHIPSEVSLKISNNLKIPTIGIGAGNQCDGQVRVTADLIGLSQKQPPFARPLIETRKICVKALESWVSEQHSQGENPTK